MWKQEAGPRADGGGVSRARATGARSCARRCGRRKSSGAIGSRSAAKKSGIRSFWTRGRAPKPVPPPSRRRTRSSRWRRKQPRGRRRGRRPSPYRAPTETQALAPALGENSAFDEKVASRAQARSARRSGRWAERAKSQRGEVPSFDAPWTSAGARCVPAFALSERPPMRRSRPSSRSAAHAYPAAARPPTAARAGGRVQNGQNDDEFAQLREESRGEAQPPVRGNSNAPARPPQYPPRAAQQLPVDDGLASARFRHSNRGASSISFAG